MTKRQQPLRKGLVILLLGLLACWGAAEDYPQDADGADPWVGEAGATWFVVVTILGENQPATNGKGPVLRLSVDQIVNYTTKSQNTNDNVIYTYSFLEKVEEGQVPGNRLAVGDKLLARWPLKQALSDPDECDKCKTEVAYDWPHLEEMDLEMRAVPGYCGVCGKKWDAGAAWERKEHWIECNDETQDRQNYCSHCGVKLKPVRSNYASPTGKWIVGGLSSGPISDGDKSFDVGGYQVPYSQGAFYQLITTLGSWESKLKGEDNWIGD